MVSHLVVLTKTHGLGMALSVRGHLEVLHPGRLLQDLAAVEVERPHPGLPEQPLHAQVPLPVLADERVLLVEGGRLAERLQHGRALLQGEGQERIGVEHSETDSN